MPAGRSSISIPGSAASSSPSAGSVARRCPSPPGKSVAATSSKWPWTAAKVSAKRVSTVRGEVGAELLELLQARLEILALDGELLDARLLGVVLLLGERVHAAERLVAALEPLELLGERVAIVALAILVL